MTYTKWKATPKSVGNLFLDPNNPRIPPASSMLSQPELITELVRHDDVYALAINIQANGFFPTEPLVAVKDDSKVVVVEGNRRLAACKLLVNPELAPDEFKARFRHLSANSSLGAFRRIPVILAPNREATIPIIIARHTSPQIQRWEPAMQASFYQKLVSSGLSIDEVAKKFNLSGGKIKEALQSHHLYQMACKLDLPDPIQQEVRNPRSFSLTTLSRIFESPTGRAFFGVEFTEDGKIRGKIPEEEFRKGFERLVTVVANRTADSRILNTPAEIKAYLEAFPKMETPDLSKPGSFESDTFLSGEPSEAVEPGATSKQKKKAKRESKGLIPHDFASNIKNQRVQAILGELKSLRLIKFPNSVALAFRCFLELTVYCFLDAKGEIEKMQKEKKAEIAARNAARPMGKPPIVLPPDWSPKLSEMIARILDSNPGLISNAQVIKAMRKTVKDEEELLALNLYAHNPDYHPSETRLRHSWKNFESFLRLISA